MMGSPDTQLRLTPPPGAQIGCDLVAVTDIRESVESFGARFLERVFTAGELDTCAGDIERLAARFAAKEAVVKTFRDRGMATPPRDIEVVLHRGIPSVVLHGAMAENARVAGWQFGQLSLSHTSCHAMAVVIATITEVS